MPLDFDLPLDYGKGDTTYLTHSFHPYPAKYPPLLPKTLLTKYGKKGQVILDPFSGSGTTLVEAKLLGFDSIGVDVNQLAALLSRVKATPLSKSQISQGIDFCNQIKQDALRWSNNRPIIQVKQIVGLDHWFQHNVAEELTFILEQINNLSDYELRDFFRIVFSSIIVKVSNQESDTHYSAKQKNLQDNYVFKQFILRAEEYLNRMRDFSESCSNRAKVTVYNADSRNLSMINDNSIDMIITSPPYANSFDYYLYHKHRMEWLDLDVKYSQNNEIGSRREYSSLKQTSSKWSDDLNSCFQEMFRVLKPGSLAFIVIGDSVINKEFINIASLVTDNTSQIGFVTKKIITTELASHSRAFKTSFMQKEKKEHVIILEK